MVRSWNFVLPEKGEHSFRVKNIGDTSQRVFLDGHEIESTPGQESFAGPDGCVLQIKQCVDPCKTSRSVDKGTKWALFVNEQQVEEADPTGNGLRDLRSMGEGSYTIAVDFDGEGVARNACRKYSFTVDDEPHEVAIAHRECVWQVALDGKLVDQERHIVSLTGSHGTAKFVVMAPNGAQVPGRIYMKWASTKVKWSYKVVVGGTQIPASWTKAEGAAAWITEGVAPPQIFSDAFPPPPLSSLPPPPPPPNISAGSDRPLFFEGVSSGSPDKQVGVATTKAIQEVELQRREREADLEESQEPQIAAQNAEMVPKSLPQGVFYDKETMSYQANIKGKSYRANIKDVNTLIYGAFASIEAVEESQESWTAAQNEKMVPDSLPQTSYGWGTSKETMSYQANVKKVNSSKFRMNKEPTLIIWE